MRGEFIQKEQLIPKWALRERFPEGGRLTKTAVGKDVRGETQCDCPSHAQLGGTTGLNWAEAAGGTLEVSGHSPCTTSYLHIGDPTQENKSLQNTIPSS